MGALQQLKVVEFAGLGAAPFCAMLLADHGADIIRIDRTGGWRKGGSFDIPNRGRQSIVLDLKKPEAVAAALRLVAGADIVLEGFRPGVMERLGLGPDDCARVNPKLVYGRMTGWGQEGPLAKTAGHDIDYIALAGVLHAIGPKGGKPMPPLNLVGDYAGAILMAFGLLAAVLEARTSGVGQVVDGAMLDGAALTMAWFHGLNAAGEWSQERGTNFLDGGAPFYDTYACADGKWLAVGPIEPQFYAALLRALGLNDLDPRGQWQRDTWEEQRKRFAAAFATKTRDEWCDLLAGQDVCVAPVLSLDEAPEHPHNAARKTFVTRDGVVQPAPAPRFSRTPGELGLPPSLPGNGGAELLRRWGFSDRDIDGLRRAAALGSEERL